MYGQLVDKTGQPAERIDPGFVQHSGLEKALREAVSATIQTENPESGTYAFAVADLTDDPAVGSSSSASLYAGI